ncbi:AlkZ-related protein [Bacillus infantis]|uniref:AlkZ-related protein n=1 Tax=Bacillus infantis TaxID=324767 RepID=UPI003CF6F39B
MKDYKAVEFNEAAVIIKELGLLPLAPLIPGYPALNTITDAESWHAGGDSDPWTWRTRFAGEGIAAYGKFISKKAVFISKDLVPLFLSVLGKADVPEERYHKGELSKEALSLFSIISAQEGIDTRLLRKEANLLGKEHKKALDQGLQELQGSMDIVISGTKEKQNEAGETNGWNSTSYETMESWMEKNGIDRLFISREEAREKLLQHFSGFCPDDAMKKISKILS